MFELAFGFRPLHRKAAKDLVHLARRVERTAPRRHDHACLEPKRLSARRGFPLGLFHRPSIIDGHGRDKSQPAPDEPIFSALLTPHRSLAAPASLILMGALSRLACHRRGFSGARRLAGFRFFGLDVLLVYVAFRLNYRAARVREEVSVSRIALDIRKVAPSGRTRRMASTRSGRVFPSPVTGRSASPILVEGQGKR